MKFILAIAAVSLCCLAGCLGLSSAPRSAFVTAAANDPTQINPANCGRRINEASSLRKRHLSATRSNQKDWGWLVLLVGEDGFSSGSLINSQWVLTHARNVE